MCLIYFSDHLYIVKKSFVEIIIEDTLQRMSQLTTPIGVLLTGAGNIDGCFDLEDFFQLDNRYFGSCFLLGSNEPSPSDLWSSQGLRYRQDSLHWVIRQCLRVCGALPTSLDVGLLFPAVPDGDRKYPVAGEDPDQCSSTRLLRVGCRDY